jgi:hypothetical protein
LDDQLKFLYALELKQIYSVSGHFYDLKIGSTVFKCRSILEIVKKDIPIDSHKLVDAVVVMMNPGSSRPLATEYKPGVFSLDEIYSPGWQKEIIPTRPDNAQYQIMRLMEFKKWQYVRVLNLSDLRNGNSGKFYDDFSRAAKIDATNPHSIFHPKRKNELKKCLNLKPEAPVILGWGNESFLCPLARAALQSLAGYIMVGVSKNDNLCYFSYPSPLLKTKKVQWLTEISQMLFS